MKKSAHEYLYDKVSLQEKQKEKWYIDAIDSIIDYSTSMDFNDMVTVRKDMELSRGNVDITFILEALKPYIPVEERKELEVNHNLYNVKGGETNSAGKIPELGYLSTIDFINQIRERYIGEYLRQFSEFQAYNRDPLAVVEFNEQLKKSIKAAVEEAIVKMIEEGMTDDELKEVDIEKKEKEFRDKWVDKKTIEYQNRLNLLNDLTNADIKYAQAFSHFFATERVCTYREIIGTNIVKEIVNPDEYYRIPNNISPFIKDDVGGVRIYKLNLREIVTKFKERITKKDIDYIKDIIENRKSGDGYSVPGYLLQDRLVDLRALNASEIYTFSKTDNVDVYHITVQSIIPIQILTYVDMLDGSIKKMEVDKDYELDEEIGDLILEAVDTFEVIDMYRIGEKSSGLYIKPEALPVQVGCLPYNGATGYLGMMLCNPVPRRVAGLQALYKFYTVQQQREVAKYKNWTIIPESILGDTEEMTRIERLEYAKKDSTLFIDDEEANANTLQTLRTLIAQGAERYIETLSNLRDGVRKEAMDIAGMNEQRYGDVNPNAGKATTEYAITRATTASIGLFFTFNQVREQDAMLDLAYSKQLWKQGFKGSYFDRNTKKVVYVEIPPEEDHPSDIGVFVKNSTDEMEKKQKLQDLAFAAAQNGELDLAVEALDAEGFTEIKKLIKDNAEAKRKLEKQMAEYQEQMRVQVEQLVNQREEGKMAHEKELKTYEEEMENLRTTIDSDTAVLVALISAGQNDGDLANRKMQLDERKVQLQESQAKLQLFKDTVIKQKKDKIAKGK